MKIEYTNRRNGSHRTFGELRHNTHYRGGETGAIYYYYEDRGRPHLVRCRDGMACTTRRQRSGTFVEVPATLRVHSYPVL